MDKLKKVSISFFLFILSPNISVAQSILSGEEINKRVINAARKYQDAISCSEIPIKPKDVVPLVSLKSTEERFMVAYAVLWVGDIGCSGGTGSAGSYISIVGVAFDDYFYVDPSRSSPQVEFGGPAKLITKISRYSHDTLLVEGKKASQNDPNCCPSINVKYKLKADAKGNWKLFK